MRRILLVLATAVAVALLRVVVAFASPDQESIRHLRHSQHPPMRQEAQMKNMAPPQAATFKVGDLVVEAPWVRATPKGAKVAGGYMKITNTGKEADRLIAGTIDRARRFEIHEMTMVDNVMRMRPLPNGIEIKPGESVELKPGGYHIMGLDLEGGYSPGRTVKGTLKFEKAGTVHVEYKVSPVGATQAPMSDMGDGMKMH
jgi:periplasmic copper chaperone A